MAEITYSFNTRGDAVWTDPDNIVDSNLETFGYTNVNGQAQLLNGNTCPGTDLGTIVKVELRLYGKGDGNDRIDITPVFSAGDGNIHQTIPVVSPGGWSSYIDITSDTNHPDWSLWSHIQDLDCKLAFAKVAKGNTVYCAKVEIRVTTAWEPPVSDIDVGAYPINRSTYYLSGVTLVNKENPANAVGTLHSVKVFAHSNITGLRVGTFYAINGNTLKCRDSVLIGDVEGGAERTFIEDSEGAPLAITVVEGDYIGCYFTGGDIDEDSSGFSGLSSESGEHIDPGDEATYILYAGRAISLYGYGDIEAPPAYYHGLKVQGVGELALCDVGSHPLRVRKGGTTYGVELVETGDPNASKIRIKTSVGIKAIRKYT